MSINLHEKYASDIMGKFIKESLVTGRLSTQYSWSGVKTVKISTLTTVPMTDYVRTGANRYGLPQEMQDTVQELTLSQDKSFAITIDKGNDADQSGIKAAGRALSAQIAERAVPAMDAYVFKVLARCAGHIAGNATPLSRQNVAERISEGTLLLDELEVPADGRTLFVSAAVYKLLKHSGEFMSVAVLAQDALVKGQVGMYDNMTVVKVPQARFPAHINFMIVHRDAATAPVKLNETRVHIDPPGLSGSLLEGRQYYDAFVFAAKCDGVYAEADTAPGKGVVAAAPAISAAGVLSSSTAGAQIRYTLDGTDPRFSKSAEVYTSALPSGSSVRAYAFKDGAYPSAVRDFSI